VNTNDDWEIVMNDTKPAKTNSKPSIILHNPEGMNGAINSLSEFWAQYSKQPACENYKLDMLIEDCLYVIGVAIDPEGYAFTNGYDKFIEDLKKWLDNKYQ
jgi:hypothetical protein